MWSKPVCTRRKSASAERGFRPLGGNVRHGQPCHVKSQSFTCTGYFCTHSYAKATGVSRGLLDFVARRALLLGSVYPPAIRPCGAESSPSGTCRTCQLCFLQGMVHQWQRPNPPPGPGEEG